MKDNQVLEQIRKLNRVFLKPDSGEAGLRDAVKAIADVISAAVIILDKDGLILGSSPGDVDSGGRLESRVKEGSLAGDPVLSAKVKAAEPHFNEPYSEQSDGKKLIYSMIPIRSGSKRLASILLLYPDRNLERDQMILAEVSAALVGMHIKHETTDQEEEKVRNKDLAEGAFESLSYSEVEAIREILKNISNNESVVVASKIADSLGITRSVIVNALRKFESAGIIESRSLGMKGTLIKVKNEHALEIVASRSAKMGTMR